MTSTPTSLLWFGAPGAEEAERHEGRAAARVADLVEACKAGDFSSREELFELVGRLQAGREKEHLVALLVAVSRHEDFENADLWTALIGDDPGVVGAFAAASPLAGSPLAAPLVLVLLDEWQDDDQLAASLRYAASELLPGPPVDFEAETSEVIADVFARRHGNWDGRAYLRGGTPVATSAVARSLISATAAFLNGSRTRPPALQAELLSLWSGDLAPLDDDTTRDDELLSRVHDYVGKLSSMPWTEGHKYFYGHDVEALATTASRE